MERFSLGICHPETHMVVVAGVIQSSSLTYLVPGLENLATGQQLSLRVASPTCRVGASPQDAGWSGYSHSPHGIYFPL